jgi:hypothetical protein
MLRIIMILITRVVAKASFERVNMTRAYGKVKRGEEKNITTGKKAVLAVLGVLPTVKTVKYLKDEGLE